MTGILPAVGSPVPIACLYVVAHARACIGLGAVACRARTLPDELFLKAARALARLVREGDRAQAASTLP